MILKIVLSICLLLPTFCEAKTIRLMPGETYCVESSPELEQEEQEAYEEEIYRAKVYPFTEALITVGCLWLGVWGMGLGSKHDDGYALATGVGFYCAFMYRIGF